MKTCLKWLYTQVTSKIDFLAMRKLSRFIDRKMTPINIAKARGFGVVRKPIFEVTCVYTCLVSLLSFTTLNADVPIQQEAKPKMDTENVVMNQILNIYRTKTGYEWATEMRQLLSQEAVLLQWNGTQVDSIRGVENIAAYLNEEIKRFPNLKKAVGRSMLAGGRVGGSLEPYNSVLVIFYEGSTTGNEGTPWVWAGCDLITIANGKIVDWRIQEDTNMKLVEHPQTIHMEREYSIIDRFWKQPTTTNDVVGMAYILDLKRTVMPTAERGRLLLARISDQIEQSTWEPQGILLLKGKKSVQNLFFDGLLEVLPDFYENVERTLVSGNAMIMVQNPSGTQKREDGTSNHRAWYNCDIYFFNGPAIIAMLFQRDTLMDINEENKKP